MRERRREGGREERGRREGKGVLDETQEEEEEGGRCNGHPAQSPALGKSGDRKSRLSWQPGSID